MKRPRALFGLGAVLALSGYLYFPLAPPTAPPASPGDCVLIHLWSNGFHSDLGVPAQALPPDHPLRRLYPHADTLLVGWGDERFYYSDGRNLWLGLNASIPPNRSVMHVVAGAEAGSQYLGPTSDVQLAISREGAAALAQYLKRSLELAPDGGVIVLRDGKVAGASHFLRARGDFHLFNVCNHWMARALRAAGLNINWRDKWLGGPLVIAARRAAQSACPTAAQTPI